MLFLLVARNDLVSPQTIYSIESSSILVADVFDVSCLGLFGPLAFFFFFVLGVSAGDLRLLVETFLLPGLFIGVLGLIVVFGLGLFVDPFRGLLLGVLGLIVTDLFVELLGVCLGVCGSERKFLDDFFFGFCTGVEGGEW